MPKGIFKRKSAYERFWSKVAITPSCWLWAASGTPNGYGSFNIEGKIKLAHRVSYEMEIGPIPEGLQIDHLCRVRECVNPSHLEPVTQQENISRGERGETGKHQSDKTHCKRGHEYSEENTYIQKQHRGSGLHRKCRTCQRQASLESYHRLKKPSNEVKS